MNQHPPSAWVRLNGYGVLIALLEIFICLFFLLDPRGGTLLWVSHIGMGLAGLLLLASYLLRRVDVEVLASVTLIAANLLDFYAEYRSIVPPMIDARNAVLQVIIILAVYLRVTALLEGGTYVIPEWPLRRRGLR